MPYVKLEFKGAIKKVVKERNRFYFNKCICPDNFEELANAAGKVPVQEVVSESAPEVPAEEETAADEYAPIVLVPSEPNPPEETEVPAEVPVETPVESPVEIAASVTETAPAIEIAPVESVTSADINFDCKSWPERKYRKPSCKIHTEISCCTCSSFKRKRISGACRTSYCRRIRNDH